MKISAQPLSTIATIMIGSFCGGIAIGQSTLEQQIDRQVHPYLQNEVAVGFTIGILQKGKSQVFGFGTVDKMQKRIPDGKTVYEIGSVSKVFTSFLLADITRCCSSIAICNWP
jgi:CubicO group peptidase (beta-lactamase class C family)